MGRVEVFIYFEGWDFAFINFTCIDYAPLGIIKFCVCKKFYLVLFRTNMEYYVMLCQGTHFTVVNQC